MGRRTDRYGRVAKVHHGRDVTGSPAHLTPTSSFAAC